MFRRISLLALLLCGCSGDIAKLRSERDVTEWTCHRCMYWAERKEGESLSPTAPTTACEDCGQRDWELRRWHRREITRVGTYYWKPGMLIEHEKQ